MRRTSGRPRRQLLRKLAQQRIRLIPIDARVGNGHAIAQAIRIVDALVTFVQVTFDHQSRNRTVARRDLLDDRIDHVALLPMMIMLEFAWEQSTMIDWARPNFSSAASQARIWSGA